VQTKRSKRDRDKEVRVLNKWLTIAELGRLSGVGVETVRYYQRLGLVTVPASRDRRSHRRYGAEQVAELDFVRACKDIGFSLKEIGLLVGLRRSQRSSCAKLHERLTELSGQLEAKRRQIDFQRSTVQSLLAACGGDTSIAECQAFAKLERREWSEPSS
jgi:MerR family mercuric resistance operon transcriptional regulator